MNELQMVLLVFAIIVIGVLLSLHIKKKNQQSKTNRPPNDAHSLKDENKALHNLEEPQLTVPSQAKPTLNVDDEDYVPDSQGRLSFGKEFDTLKEQKTTDLMVEAEEKLNHPILPDDSSLSVKPSLESESKEAIKLNKNYPTLSFGKPESEIVPEVKTALHKDKAPQVFVIIVMGTKEFNMAELHKYLLKVGLSYSEQGIYFKKNSQGKEYIHVANILEPGVFPAISSEGFEQSKIQGIALILELPTCIKAPAAMNDMVDIARKISQKFNSRLYDGERRLLKESEIQVMRDLAISYEAREVIN